MAVARVAPPLINSANRVAADFLRIDSELALTFSGIALATVDEETRSRTNTAACRAYKTIARLRGNVDLSDTPSERNSTPTCSGEEPNFRALASPYSSRLG